MTRAKDISKIITDADFSGTLDVTGDLTVVGSSTFDDIKLTGVSLPAAGNPSIALRDTNNIVYHQSGSGNSIVLLDSSQNTMYNVSSTSHIFNISNSEKMRIDDGGHILFGTTSLPTTGGGAGFDPDNNGRMVLHLGSNSTAQKDLITLKDSNGVVGAIQTVGGAIAIDVNELRINHGAGSSDTTTFRITGGTSGVSQLQLADTSDGNVGMLEYNHSSNYLMFQVNNAERMRIDASGNVGIGNTGNSSRKLDITQDSGQSAGVRVRSDGSGAYYQMFTGTANPKIGSSHNTDQIELHTGGSERMRIGAGGNVSIGVTTAAARFDVTANVNPLVKFHQQSTANDIGVIMQHARGLSGFSGKMIAFRRNDGTEVGSVVIGVSSTSYNTSSDHRLKESVTYDFDATTRLKQLKPCRFNFIDNADTTVDGFLAHEVQSVVPEAITGTHNEVDDDGNPVYQGIDQSKLVPLLVKTIQELEARITALETA